MLGAITSPATPTALPETIPPAAAAASWFADFLAQAFASQTSEMPNASTTASDTADAATPRVTGEGEPSACDQNCGSTTRAPQPSRKKDDNLPDAFPSLTSLMPTITVFSSALPQAADAVFGTSLAQDGAALLDRAAPVTSEQSTDGPSLQKPVASGTLPSEPSDEVALAFKSMQQAKSPLSVTEPGMEITSNVVDSGKATAGKTASTEDPSQAVSAISDCIVESPPIPAQSGNQPAAPPAESAAVVAQPGPGQVPQVLEYAAAQPQGCEVSGPANQARGTAVSRPGKVQPNSPNSSAKSSSGHESSSSQSSEVSRYNSDTFSVKHAGALDQDHPYDRRAQAQRAPVNGPNQGKNENPAESFDADSVSSALPAGSASAHALTAVVHDTTASVPASQSSVVPVASADSHVTAPAMLNSGSLPQPIYPITGETDPALQVHAAKVVQTPAVAEMRIGLHTDSFGSIQVHTSVASRQVDVAVASEHGDLRMSLGPELPTLQSALQQHDLRLEQVRSLAQPAGATAEFSAGSSSSGSSRQQQQNSRPPALPSLGYGSARVTEAPEPAPIVFIGSHRNLSIRV